jgi:tetratricopeptide (TPR) repeat protein
LDLAIEAAKQLSDIHDEQAMELWGIVQVQAKMRDFANALETAQQINVGHRRVDALKTIAEAQAEAREFAAALELVRQINDEWKRSETIAMIAEEQVKAGHGQQALKTTETILTERQWRLPGVAAVFVKTGDKANFKRLLIPCAYYLDAAYRMCGHLAWMYPEKAEEIAKVVSEFC